MRLPGVKGLPISDPFFLQHGRRDPKGINGCWHATVNGYLHQHRADLVFAATIAKRAAYVQLQFVGPIERTDHGEVDQAAGTAGEVGLSPDFAPAVFGHQLLQGAIEVVGVGQ